MQANKFLRHFGILLLVVLQSCSSIENAAKTSPVSIKEIADRYYAFTLQATPEISYFSGVKIDHHDGITDNSPQGLLRIHAVEDKLLSQLQKFDLHQQLL